MRNSYPKEGDSQFHGGLENKVINVILQVLEKGSQASRHVGISVDPLPSKRWTRSEEWTLVDSFI